MTVPTPHEPFVAVRAAASPARAATVEHGVLERECATLDVAAASCRAPRRDVNEDAHSTLQRSAPVFVVADGVGGGAMAARASREVVARVHDVLDGRSIDDDTVRSAVLVADRDVARSIADYTDRLGAATVALCASSDGALSKWLLAWVGDCRVYRVGATGGGDAEQLTQDDTYRHLAEMPPVGGSPDDPARMVGNGAVSAPNVKHIDLADGDMLVLCSDGVHKYVRADELARMLRTDAMPLVRRCARLLAHARARGSRDDATVLVVHKQAAPVSPRERPVQDRR